jgi:hypothetical protein
MTLLPAQEPGEPAEPIGVYAISAHDATTPPALTGRIGSRPVAVDEGAWLRELAMARGPFLADLLYHAALDQATFHVAG